MTDNCSSLQRQTSTVYEFSKEEASLTVRKVKTFVSAALATSSVCTVKQPAATVMSTFQKDCDFLKFSLIKLFMQWVELSETLPFDSEPRVARLFTLFFLRYKLRFCTALRQIFAIFSREFRREWPQFYKFELPSLFPSSPIKYYLFIQIGMLNLQN